MAARDYPALMAFLASRMRAPFAWAQNDCASFAFDAVRAQTGEDRLADLRRRYKTAAGAARILKAEGGLAGVCDRRLRPIPVALAQRGDVGLVLNQDGDETLVVIDGAAVIGVGRERAMRWPRAALRKAWSAD